jgi:hypothetical protein
MNVKAGRILVLALLGVLLVTAAGCGGKSNNASSNTPTTTAATTTAATTTAATTTTATTTSSSTGSDLSKLASSANCHQLLDLGAKLSAAFSGSNNDLQKQAKLLKEFADKTPSDIRPDFEVLADAMTKIAKDLKGVDLSSGKTPTPAQLAKIQKLSTEIDQAKLQTASAHITTWAQSHCKTS